MELSKKETYRNKKVSLGVTILSFVVMLMFFIFTNVVTANSSSFVASPEILLNTETASTENAGNSISDGVKSSSSQKESGSTEILSASSEIPLAEGVSDIVNKFTSGHFLNSSEELISEVKDPGNSIRGIEGAKGTNTETKLISPNIVFSLGRRTILTRPTIQSTTQAEGTVVVDITVDKTGKVIDANPNGRGSNTNNPALKSEAAKLALATKFNSDDNFEEQRGTITIIFSFD